MRRVIFLVLLAVISLGVATLVALTYPLTAYVAWDPNPLTDAVTSYLVTLDGATVAIVDPTSACATAPCKQAISVPNSLSHTACVSSTNAWGTSTPTCVGFVAAAPGKSTNVKITAQ